MSKEILIPELDNDVASYTIAEWFFKKGDSVKVGDVLAEIESDKVTIELEAEIDGVIAEIIHEAGDDPITSGTLIALFA